MKILFTNLADTATLSAGGTLSVNYPLANLTHVFLTKKFQQIVSALSDAQALTLTWAADQTIDFVALGYTNGTAFTLKLYDSASTLLFTQTFTSAEMGATFTAVSGVRSAKLVIDDGTAVFPMTVYLGGIGIGLSTDIGRPLYDWRPECIDNSFGAETIDGQVLGQYIEPLRRPKFSFITSSRATLDAVQAGVNAVGKYTPVYVIPFTGALATVKPLYCTIPEGVESPARDGLLYTFSLTLQEAR